MDIAMNIYRLDPIDPRHASWRDSNELEGVWVSAPTPSEARDLAAERTRVETHSTNGHFPKSPWQDDTVTSCIWEPSMRHIRPGTVVRLDGSLVGD